MRTYVLVGMWWVSEGSLWVRISSCESWTTLFVPNGHAQVAVDQQIQPQILAEPQKHGHTPTPCSYIYIYIRVVLVALVVVAVLIPTSSLFRTSKQKANTTCSVFFCDPAATGVAKVFLPPKGSGCT